MGSEGNTAELGLEKSTFGLAGVYPGLCGVSCGLDGLYSGLSGAFCGILMAGFCEKIVGLGGIDTDSLIVVSR